MELINISNEYKNTLRVLKSGGIILYPTDTIWGIGCDATNEEAIKKIFNIKRREESKALISLVSSKNQLKRIVTEIPKIDITSSPTTVVYPKVNGISKLAISSNGSAAIRITKDTFCKKLIDKFSKPIISTSANISGEDYPKKFSEISNDILTKVDYIVKLKQNIKMISPSKIILICENGKIKKIR